MISIDAEIASIVTEFSDEMFCDRSTLPSLLWVLRLEIFCGSMEMERERVLTHDGQLTRGKADEGKDLAYDYSHFSRVNGAKKMNKAHYTQLQSLQSIQQRQIKWLEGPFPTITVITVASAKGEWMDYMQDLDSEVKEEFHCLPLVQRAVYLTCPACYSLHKSRPATS